MRTHSKLLLVTLAATIGTTACSESSAVNSPVSPPITAAADAAPKFWDVGASTYWQDRATALTRTRTTSAARLYTYLAMAQYRAAKSAELMLPHPPISSAIGGASVVVLKQFFPLDAAAIEAGLAEQKAWAPWPGAKHEDFDAGEALGRAVAAQVLLFATTDRVGLANPGTPPLGAGYWVWSGGPIVRGQYQARPLFLDSQNEFLPGPPPAFGSPAYLAALAEVRHISDTRTAEQLAIAQFWHVNQAPSSGAAISDIAVELIRSHHVGDAKAAELFFRMYAAQFDASIGCFNAKYHYWFIRPPQADPLITLPLGLPAHPSYPSAHSCVSGALNGVLAASFPDEARRLDAIAIEASLSRLYGGIHYRFDMEAGLALGRNVARKVMAADLSSLSITP